MNHLGASPGIDFTIAICTYNRSDMLPGAVRAAMAQDYPHGKFEVLVVNNNSTDDTAGAIDALQNTFPSLRSCFEGRQGLNHARNRALSESGGGVIVYIDDDAEIDRAYLRALKTLLQEEDNVGVAGGPIEIGWVCPVPNWYEPELDAYFSRLYISSYRMELRYPRFLWGTNMAFPVTTLRELGGFHPDLDRMGIKQLSGGDTEMMIRVATEARRRILYDPALKVRHLIHPSRLTREYILHRAYWDGRSACRLSRLHPGMGGAKEAIFTLFGGILRQTLGLKRGEIFEQAQVVWSRGYLKEWLLRRRA